MQIEKVGLPAEDLFEQRDNGVILGNLPGPAQALAEGTAFVDHDPPLAVVFMGGRFVRVSADAHQVSGAIPAETEVPAPVFLAGRVGCDTAFGQFLAEPCGEILAKAARIDEVIADFGKIEAARAEQEIDGVHGFAHPGWLVLYHAASFLGRENGRR
jgi:hypothetical protein